MSGKTAVAPLYLVVLLGVSRVFAGPTLTTLVNFNVNNGSKPTSGLIADSAGNLYGTSSTDGYLNGGGFGGGTVFEITPGTDAFTTLAYFNGTDGQLPFGTLLGDANGNLYGTTYYGGLRTDDGLVFKIAAGSRTLSTLATFNSTNGSNPATGLIADASGNLYGTTDGYASNNDGTVFKLAAGTNALTTLVTFTGSNGDLPVCTLVADASGNLYGEVAYGGSNNDGTVFKIAKGTNTFSTVATFNGANGANPGGGLNFDASGNLYGTTSGGGTSGDGTVFKIAAGTHALSTLANFNGSNGNEPECNLIANYAGNLYGTTNAGGTDNDGTVFELNPQTDALTTLATFNNANGENPSDGLTADASGNLYGTTYGGGANYDGTIFELSGTDFSLPEPGSLILSTISCAALLRRRHRRM